MTDQENKIPRRGSVSFDYEIGPDVEVVTDMDLIMKILKLLGEHSRMTNVRINGEQDG